MKKCSILLLSVIFLVLFAIPVHAASFSLSAGTKQVTPGSSFSIRVGGDAIGRVNLSVTNGTLSTSSVWVEQNYVTVNVTAGQSGTVIVTATPVVGFSDADANLYNPGVKSVSITISNNSTNTKPSTSNPKPNTGTSVPKKSSNNDLSSLKVSEGTLSPNFESTKSEYHLNLPKEVKEITIEANAEDDKAKIEGLGKRSLQPGDNEIQVIVTAENGNKKTYILHVYVEEVPEVYLNYQEQQIGIVKNVKNVSIPEGFTKETISINDKEVTIFIKENIMLIYGQKEDQTKNFYVYDKEKQEITHLCIPIKINNKMYYLLDEPKKETEEEKITIDNIEVTCTTKDENYCVFFAIKENGEQVEYLYEKSEGTMQLFPFFLNQCEPSKAKEPLLWTLSGIFILLISIFAVFFIKEKRGSKHEKGS